MSENANETASDFIRDIVATDRQAGKHATVVTRFPPEPNGYIHIGHAKAICIDFGIAMENNGRCHLRFDDTDPAKEEVEYVDSIMADIRWLGFDWGKHLYYASDYYEQTYQCAEDLVRRGLAYVCELTQDEFKEYRGAPTSPGREPPGRNRSPDENLAMFRRMRAGEFEEGQYVLRARIDMSSPNLHLRDPVLYRIKKAEHYRTGRTWCIYPMYDFAHPIGDAIEGVTYSLCTLEYEVHRPLYDWVVINCNLPARPRQIEFSRLSLSYTVMSKRKLLELVKGGFVTGWDDPRMPTVCGLRRRGYTPASIRAFCRKIGVTKFDGITDVALLEHCIREELNRTASRVMAVLRPLKVVITNYPEGQSEDVEAVNNPEDPASGSRRVRFSRELWIEQDDFMENPSKQFFRLAPGREVRLRYGNFITCKEVVKDPATGEVRELHCTYDPATRGGNAPDGRKVKATIHWVSAAHAVPVETRLYDRLFRVEEPDNVTDGQDFKVNLNPRSLETITAMVEPIAAQTAEPGVTRFQFERKGYFFADQKDSKPGKPVFIQIATLKDAWAKIEKKK
jgi:glutaminyl-tRNA synthetase